MAKGTHASDSEFFKYLKILLRFQFLHECHFKCLLQCTICFTIASQVFAPIFLKHGVMGSIGAHMSWNLGILTVVPQVLCRLVCRYLKPLSKAARRMWWKDGRD